MKQDDIDAMLAGLDEPAEPEPPPPPPPPEPEPEPDVLELTEAMQAPAIARLPQDRRAAGRGVRGGAGARAAASAAARPSRRRAWRRRLRCREPAIMSSATAAAVDSAFNALAHTVLVQNAKTLEDLVKEMLRPMLQHWLDNNLPTLVERLVRQEIERVARGRG